MVLEKFPRSFLPRTFFLIYISSKYVFRATIQLCTIFVPVHYRNWLPPRTIIGGMRFGHCHISIKYAVFLRILSLWRSTICKYTHPHFTGSSEPATKRHGAKSSPPKWVFNVLLNVFKYSSPHYVQHSLSSTKIRPTEETQTGNFATSTTSTSEKRTFRRTLR